MIMPTVASGQELIRPYTIRPTKGKIRPIGIIGRSLGIKMVEFERDNPLLNGDSGRAYDLKDYLKHQNKIEIIDGREIDKYIVIAEDLTQEEKWLTAAHELAHFILGHLLGEEDENFNVPYRQQEFEAEALGFILFNFLYGIDGRRTGEKE